MAQGAQRARMAATVLVLAPKKSFVGSSAPVGRFEGASEGNHDFRILFVKRHSKMKFMGDFYVFPGGAVDEDDGHRDWVHSHPQQRDEQLQLLPPEEFSHRVAAVRELFEESGILCARSTSSQSSSKDRFVSVVPPDRCRNLERFRHESSQSSSKDRFVSVVPPDRCRNLERFRHEVHDDATRFRSLCRDHSIAPDIAALRPWSRWVTPPGQSRRFDTFFYLTALSDSTTVPTPSVDAKETTHAVWMDPEEALSASRAGKIMLAPPTSYTLSELARCGNIAHVLEHLSIRHFEPIHPKRGKTESLGVVPSRTHVLEHLSIRHFEPIHPKRGKTEVTRCGNIAHVLDHLSIGHFEPIHPKRGKTKESRLCALYPGDFAYDDPTLSAEPRRGRPVHRNIMQNAKDRKHTYWVFEREGTKLDVAPSKL